MAERWQVKSEMGGDAVILHTRSYSDGDAGLVCGA